MAFKMWLGAVKNSECRAPYGWRGSALVAVETVVEPQWFRRMRHDPGALFQTHFWPVRGAGLYVAAALLVLAGCGPGSDRLEIGGIVKLDGAPLDSGTIQFSSLGAEKLISTGAMISDGEYHVPQEKGLPPGSYRVEITSPDTSAPPVAFRPAPGEPSMRSAPERIPADYNVNSKQTIQVETDSDNHFEFDVLSRKTSKSQSPSAKK